MDISFSYRWAVSAIALVVFKLTANKVLSIRTALAGIKYVCSAYIVATLTYLRRDYPGRVLLWLKPFSPQAIVLGATFPRPGMGGYYAGKFSCTSHSLVRLPMQTCRHLVYRKFRVTSFASVEVSAAQQTFWIADAEAIKLVTSDRHIFKKDVAEYEVLNFGGANLVSVKESDWKRHRSVAMSAFNEASRLSLTPSDIF